MLAEYLSLNFRPNALQIIVSSDKLQKLFTEGFAYLEPMEVDVAV